MLYTVDRTRKVGTNDSFGWINNVPNEEPFRSTLLRLHPEGLSRHGMEYINNCHKCFQNNETALELYFEAIRRMQFSHLPSRFECMFCCESLDDALVMRGILNSPDAPIFEVYSTGATHRANMSLLTSGGSALMMPYRADEYWSGRSGGMPEMWEILVQLPVTIGPQVR